jgi:hypothetical protein
VLAVGLAARVSRPRFQAAPPHSFVLLACPVSVCWLHHCAGVDWPLQSVPSASNTRCAAVQHCCATAEQAGVQCHVLTYCKALSGGGAEQAMMVVMVHDQGLQCAQTLLVGFRFQVRLNCQGTC